MSAPVIHMWPTTIYQKQIDDPNTVDALHHAILEHEHGDTSRSLGVVNARKSSPDLLRWQLPAATRLAGYISDAVDAVAENPAALSAPRSAHAWAVVYRPGGSHELHAHHDSAWSGVFYIATSPEPARGGAIELFDPRTTLLARTAGPAPVTRIQPRPGLMILFPSWLLHRVTPVHGVDLRICVAFNVAFGKE